MPIQSPATSTLHAATKARGENVGLLGAILFGAAVGWLIWRLAPRRLKEGYPPSGRNELSAPATLNPSNRANERIGVSWICVFLLIGLARLGTAVFVLLLMYGIAVIIFRYAFGVELPNPIGSW
jgi:hypothetical protein